MDIRQLVREYGAGNLRVFITEEERSALFRAPEETRTEYYIDPKRDNPTGHHKICFRKVRSSKPVDAPGWTAGIFDEKRMYISDFNNSKNVEVYVLVDEDNKYERLV